MVHPARRWRAAAGVAALALLVSACAVREGVGLPPMDDWDARRAVLAGLPAWSFTGRIGVSAGEEGFNGRLRWQQQRDRYEATVSGPLGIGTVRIAGDEGHVRVTDKDGAVTELSDPEADLRYLYGWTIPVSSLRYWALGIPDPAVPAVTDFGEDGRLRRMEQRNWTVTIGQYADGGGQPMPRRVAAVSDDARVRLVIDRWTFY